MSVRGAEFGRVGELVGVRSDRLADGGEHAGVVESRGVAASDHAVDVIGQEAGMIDDGRQRIDRHEAHPDRR